MAMESVFQRAEYSMTVVLISEISVVNTMMPPAMMPGRISGMVTRHIVAPQVAPATVEASSMRGSTCATEATTAR